MSEYVGTQCYDFKDELKGVIDEKKYNLAKLHQCFLKGLALYNRLDKELNNVTALHLIEKHRLKQVKKTLARVLDEICNIRSRMERLIRGHEGQVNLAWHLKVHPDMKYACNYGRVIAWMSQAADYKRSTASAGECSGYVHAWVKADCEKRQPFGLSEESGEAPFITLDRDIATLQRGRLRGRDNGFCRFRKCGIRRYIGSADRMADNLLQSSNASQYIYAIRLINSIGIEMHSVAFRRRDDGVEFMDANMGWVSFRDEASFRAFFTLYYEQRLSPYTMYSINDCVPLQGARVKLGWRDVVTMLFSGVEREILLRNKWSFLLMSLLVSLGVTLLICGFIPCLVPASFFIAEVVFLFNLLLVKGGVIVPYQMLRCALSLVKDALFFPVKKLWLCIVRACFEPQQAVPLETVSLPLPFDQASSLGDPATFESMKGSYRYLYDKEKKWLPSFFKRISSGMVEQVDAISKEGFRTYAEEHEGSRTADALGLVGVV